jgi:tetratricopeptide (TPR) repeat protein
LRRFGTGGGETGHELNPVNSKQPLSRLVIEKLPLFALAIFSSCITIYVQKEEALHTLEVTSLSFRIANALVAYLRYLGKMIWPSDLAVLYPLPHTIPLLQSIGSAILLLLISYGAYALSYKRPYLLVGWLWFLGTLIPVIGIVQVGLQSMADRYTYFPLIGIFILIVWEGADLVAHLPSWRIPLILATVGSLTVCSAVTWSYVRVWKSSITLFTHAIEATSDNYYAHYMLGKTLYEENDFPKALAQYVIAYQLNPRFPDAYINMGIILAKQGNVTEAINNFMIALSLKPGSPYVHYNLAVALLTQGKPEEAMVHLREVLRLDPENIGAHYNLGVASMRLNRWDEAISHFTEVLRLKPELEDARQNLQICIQQKGNK